MPVTVVKFNDSTDVKKIRTSMKLGIDAFATLVGTTRKTIEKWEAKASTPKGAAKNLLILMRDCPDMVKNTLLNTVTIHKKA